MKSTRCQHWSGFSHFRPGSCWDELKGSTGQEVTAEWHFTTELTDVGCNGGERRRKSSKRGKIRWTGSVLPVNLGYSSWFLLLRVNTEDKFFQGMNIVTLCGYKENCMAKVTVAGRLSTSCLTCELNYFVRHKTQKLCTKRLYFCKTSLLDGEFLMPVELLFILPMLGQTMQVYQFRDSFLQTMLSSQQEWSVLYKRKLLDMPNPSYF